MNPRADVALREIAWRLPRRLVMWCYVRVVAHGTAGRYSETVPGELDVVTALARWNRPD